MEEDDGAVLCAPVRPLAIELGGIVQGEECLKQLLIADPRGIEGQFYNFGVSGLVGADVFVCRLVHRSAFIADGGFYYSGDLRKACFHAPEASCAESCLFHRTPLFFKITPVCRAIHSSRPRPWVR